MDNLNVYENLLAKSEAVFYYHCVLNVSDGSIVNLTEPQETVPGEQAGNASAAATAARRRSRLSSDSLSDGEEDDASTTTTTAAPAGDPQKYHPLTKRFGGDISFVGSLDVAVNASGTMFPATAARRAITKTPLSSLTRTPSAGPVSNPYISSSSTARGPASAPPATSMVRVREKMSKGSPTIDALFSAAAAKKSPKAVETQQRQGNGGSTANASGKGASSNMFAGFAHGDATESNANAEDDVVHVDDSDSDDDGETDAPVQAAKTSEPDDPTATSRHFTSKPTTGEKRKVSFDSPEKEDDAAEAASSPSPAKKTRKGADKSPASDGSGFWSDGDKDDCIVVEEPPPKSSSKAQTSSTGASFAAAHQSHSRAQGGKENTGNAASSSSGFISVFRSSQMDRMPRGSSKKSKSGSGKKSKQQQKRKSSGSGGLLEGFERQKKNAAADGSAVIKESLEDRKRRLSNASRRSSTSSSTSTGGGAKKRKSAPNLSSFFGPLDLSTKPTRKSF